MLRIDETQLKARPDTLLAMLARQDQDGNGGSETSPIAVRPHKSCAESYSAPTLEVVSSFYADLPLALPPGVELEEIACVLDFFGVPNDVAKISLENATLPARMRARCFLAERANFEEGKVAILKTLDSTLQGARREYSFLAFLHNWSMAYLCGAHGDENFFTIGSYPDSGKHIAWTKIQAYRDAMAAEIKDKGLGASWRLRHHLPVNGSDEANPGFRMEVAVSLWVLTVTLPDAEPLAKRRRAAAD